MEEEFLRLLEDERLCLLFRSFLKDSFSGENLTFWYPFFRYFFLSLLSTPSRLEVEKFKRIPPKEKEEIVYYGIILFRS